MFTGTAIVASTGAFLSVLVFYALFVIGSWKMFVKAGEPGWKSIIPVYNTYILYKLCWKTSMFWMMLILAVVYSIANQMASGENSSFLISLASIILGIAFIVIQFKFCRRIATSFCQGTGFAIGLLLLPSIFTIILGFGSSKYINSVEAEHFRY